MKKYLFLMAFFCSVANSSQNLEYQRLENLIKVTCSENANPGVCIKAFNGALAYSQATSDYYYFCEKSKSMSMSTDKERCEDAKEFRKSIEGNAN